MSQPHHGPMEASEADQGASTGTSAGFLCRRAARAGQEVFSPPPTVLMAGERKCTFPSHPWKLLGVQCSAVEPSHSSLSSWLLNHPLPSPTSWLSHYSTRLSPPPRWPLAPGPADPGPTSSPSWCPCEAVWCLGTEDAPFTQKVHRSTHTLLSN